MEVVLAGKFLDIHVEPALLEIFSLVVRPVLSGVVVTVSPNHHVACLVGVGLARLNILRRLETEY